MSCIDSSDEPSPKTPGQPVHPHLDSFAAAAVAAAPASLEGPLEVVACQQQPLSESALLGVPRLCSKMAFRLFLVSANILLGCIKVDEVKQAVQIQSGPSFLAIVLAAPSFVDDRTIGGRPLAAPMPASPARLDHCDAVRDLRGKTAQQHPIGIQVSG